MQIGGAAVVAKARPGGPHIIALAQRPDRSPWASGRETLKIGTTSCNSGLLQHDFRKPDLVGVLPFACLAFGRAYAPGQLAGVAVVPGKQIACLRGVLWRAGHAAS
jgi:hypothetical protein